MTIQKAFTEMKDKTDDKISVQLLVGTLIAIEIALTICKRID